MAVNSPDILLANYDRFSGKNITPENPHEAMLNRFESFYLRLQEALKPENNDKNFSAKVTAAEGVRFQLVQAERLKFYPIATPHARKILAQAY